MVMGQADSDINVDKGSGEKSGLKTRIWVLLA